MTVDGTGWDGIEWDAMEWDAMDGLEILNFEFRFFCNDRNQ